MAEKPESACPFSDILLWGMVVGNVVGGVGGCITDAAGRTVTSLMHLRATQVASPVLEASYARKKEQLVARCGMNNVNECFLFHGTSIDNSEAIIVNNFCLTKVSSDTMCAANECGKIIMLLTRRAIS